MDPLRRLVQLLGNDRAVANAHAMCERHRAEDEAVRALADRLGSTRPAPPVTTAA